MSPILYTIDPSPPCRAVYMTAKSINIELEHKLINVIKGEQHDPEFVKINPRHSVPTLVDGDLILTDSHAITAYLVSKYSKDDALYPKAVSRRALVDQMLHFDSNVAFVALFNAAAPIRLKLTKEVPEDKIIKVHEVYAILEKYLNGKNWVSLDHATIADYHLLATITSLEIFVSLEDYPNIVAWVERGKELSNYGENAKGLEDFTNIMHTLMNG